MLFKICIKKFNTFIQKLKDTNMRGAYLSFRFHGNLKFILRLTTKV